jgi:hypothetical protein
MHSPNKPKRGTLHQWYAKHLKKLTTGNTTHRTAIFKINGRRVEIEIPVYMWRKAVRHNPTMRKMRVVVMDMAKHRARTNNHDATTMAQTGRFRQPLDITR